jgi:ribonuclease G
MPEMRARTREASTGHVLLVNATHREARVALVEQGSLAEFHVERKRDRGFAGHIYKGKVLRVLPGMQAAFVDIGQEKAAFLYVSDVYNQHEAYMSGKPSQDIPPAEPHPTHLSAAPLTDAPDIHESPESTDHLDPLIPQSRGRSRPTGPIETRLREGQEILVQVSKEPIGSKGARVTSHITLPGRHLVHMPTFDHVGVSRRIESDEERRRLRELVEELRRPGSGFIVRTASEGVSREQLAPDIDYLETVWRVILEQFEQRHAPALLYEDLDLIRRSARDLLTDDIDALILDNLQEWEQTRTFVQRFMPQYIDAIQLYDGEEPIFDAHGIEMEIERSLDKKVWLKSGGYLVIDQTEALTAVDINTGKFVGKHTLEDTILQINLEAVREIVYQLKLRNIGGLIIIDFIDMEKPAHREKVFNALEDALKKDKAKTHILQISEFGLIEMTRKRVRESLVQALCEPCPYCEGRGYVKSHRTVAYEILRQLSREVSTTHAHTLDVIAHRDVAHLLYDEEAETIAALETKWGGRVEIKANPTFHVEQYEVVEKNKPTSSPV